VPGVARTIRVAERGLRQVEQRMAEIAHPVTAQPETSASR